jgi:hypothetical protein
LWYYLSVLTIRVPYASHTAQMLGKNFM